MQRSYFHIAAAIMLALSVGCAEKGNMVNPSGTLEAVEIDLSPALAGRVLEVRPRLGDRVAEGDTLLILDTELIALRRAQTAAGIASIEAQARVAGDRQAQAELSLKLAELTHERIKTLVNEGSGTQQQLDEVRTQRDFAEKQVIEAGHSLDALHAERVKLNAALAVFDRQLRDGVLIAPSDGTVLIRNVEPGEMINPGLVALRIADLSRLELRVYLGETDMDRVHIGQILPVRVDAFENRELNGIVTWISPEAEFTPKNAQTRDARTQLVYAAKLRLDNPDGKLHIGMPSEVILP